MNKENNPPAFPCGYHPEGNSADQQGMTLRDYFAAKALNGLLVSNLIELGGKHVTELTQQDWAVAAYLYADAMMLERNKETK